MAIDLAGSINSDQRPIKALVINSDAFSGVLVGHKKITRIQAYEEVTGEIWFRIWAGETLRYRLPSRHVVLVEYQK